MRRFIVAGLFSAGCVLMAGGAGAQSSCPDGRTAAGRCIDPGLAETARQSAIIYSQPKISQTHYPVLPALDWLFRYPNQLNPDQARPAPTGTAPGP
jgi:hypothetical protein